MSLSMAGPIFGNWQGYLLSSNLGWLGILSTSGLMLSTATANKVTGTRQRLGGNANGFSLFFLPRFRKRAQVNLPEREDCPSPHRALARSLWEAIIPGPRVRRQIVLSPL
ncbi:hypothetical protein V6N13_116610 [Hibiscus sabdariffa]|uniref:Uncharacterized protein n=2 Tax=Hibiscus sabdariffa TaxID=183260 RepID=A0ABR2QGT8_9ROSI